MTVIVIAILIVLFIAAIIFGLAASAAEVQEVRGSNHQLLNNMHFSTQAFYETVEKEIINQNIPGLSFSRITYKEGGLFSALREYLRIRRKEYVFDICCAPFAKGTFVSWWLGEVERIPYRQYLLRIPVIGRLFQKRNKTYFELDNEAMFKELAKGAINKVISQFSEVKGIRPTQVDVPTLEQPAMV
jgi:hypothetical protein